MSSVILLRKTAEKYWKTGKISKKKKERIPVRVMTPFSAVYPAHFHRFIMHMRYRTGLQDWDLTGKKPAMSIKRY